MKKLTPKRRKLLDRFFKKMMKAYGDVIKRL